MRAYLILAFCLLPAVAAAEGSLDPALACQAKRSSPVTYEVELAAIVTASYHTKTLKVWIPIPPSDETQTIESLAWSTFPDDIKPALATEKVHGNRFAYYEFDHPQGAQIIRHRFRATTHDLHWNIAPEKISMPATWPESFAPYLKSDQTVVVNDQVRAQLDRIVPTRKSPAADLASVMLWTQQTLKYDHGQASLAAS